MYKIGEKVILVRGNDRLTESVGKPFTVSNVLIGMVEITDGVHKYVVMESFVKKQNKLFTNLKEYVII